MVAKETIDKCKLYYELTERKPMKVAPKASKKVNNKSTNQRKKATTTKAKQSKKTFGSKVRSKLDKVAKSLSFILVKDKKLTKAERKKKTKERINGIIGVGLLFVIVSIAYSTYVVTLFVDGTTALIAVAPQVIFASVTLFKAFYKMYK